ncbi:hypothetical protein [Streptomyces sp. NPDC091217]|uniref:hypothetical protein n=1 Tax=Streptomyces sp. NPDC091217 TaxID=3365975 RepID=UPI0037FB80F3
MSSNYIRVSAEQARHVGAGWIALFAFLGAAVLLITLPAAGKKKGPIPEPDREKARSSV